MICEISETEFDTRTDLGAEAAYLAIVCDSRPIAWLATDDRSAPGIVRRDRDGDEISFSWGTYRGGKYVGHGTGCPSEHEALVACARRMLGEGDE